MALSRAAYGGLRALGAPSLARRLRPGAPVFSFHNVVPDAEAGRGDVSLHVPVGAFASIVAWIGASYEVVALGELVDRTAAGRSVRGLAAITFDDAYHGVFEHALGPLAAAGMPCTIFVVSGFAERPAITWWDALGSRGLLTEERRAEALRAHRGLAPEVLRAAGVEGPATDAPLPDAFLPATWDRILRSAGDGVELGSHTVRHPNLAALEPAELDEELARSRREIAERTSREVESIAYPYGLWSPRVAEAARRAGYRIGATTEIRPFTAREEPLGVPRVNVPAGISIDALACWAAGIRLRRPW